jgi:hypothetical protein
LIIFNIQKVIGAFFRVDKDHPKRFLFNYFHRTLGVLTFLLASKFNFSCLFILINIHLNILVVSIYLGLIIKNLNTGWQLMIGWTVWLVILPFMLEFFDVFNNRRKGNKF